ncbi:MAG: bifunctional tRNA (5-methylaminomethyl-2-thiouridine)(34)-methyltransferase MnmD/FAD-dependent 5-carboxymethylaminomethyl-2-thiouridine(34) oxidoreductase MnmC [Thiotrichales bacterium]
MNENARVVLRGQALYSERFDDTYASRGDPLAEKRYVFAAGNDLAARFAIAERFVIGELGFGAGLGFLAACALWRDTAPAGAWLDFISVEQFPLPAATLCEALAPFPELAELRDALLAAYPIPLRGWHRIELPRVRVRLILIVDEALAALRGLDQPVDAWFLDGFAPRKNPAMWRPELLRELARLAHPATTFATYTAAAQVRRDLEAAGFVTHKRPGFGAKRECLAGHYRGTTMTAQTEAPWFLRGAAPPTERSAIVIGAGLAGAACANRLAARGFAVTVLERGATLAAECSGNPAAVFYPYLTRDDNAAARLSRLGYQYTLQTLARLDNGGLSPGFHRTGLADLALNDAEFELKQQAFAPLAAPADFAHWLEAAAVAAHCGWAAPTPGLWYPDGGWIALPALCAALLREHPGRVALRCGHEVTAIAQHDGRWQAFTTDPSRPAATAACLVLANANAAARFPPTAYLPLTPNRGQLSGWRGEHRLTAALSHQAYCVSDDERLWFGSSHVPNATDLAPSTREQRRNLARLAALHPALAHQLSDRAALDAWVGLRATTADHLPLAGEIVDPAAFTTRYAGMARGERAREPLPPPTVPGLFVLSGLGSRALTGGLLAAELVAALANAEPLPVDRGVYRALHPSRFLLRALKRAPRAGRSPAAASE